MPPAATERQQATQDINPNLHPGAYLQSRGWKCLGNPEWERSLWLDPDKPLVSSYTEEPCMYDVEVRHEERGPDGNVKVTYRPERRQIMAQDGRGGAPVGARRAVFHPEGEPLSIQQAIYIQLSRDAREDLARQQKAKK